MQKNHEIFSQLIATLIVKVILLLECKNSSVVAQARHIDLTYYTLTRHCHYF